MGSEQASSKRIRAGVTARLIALMLLPVTATCMLAGAVVVARQSTARQAGIVAHGVIALNQLVGLRDSLHAQQSAQAFDVRFLQVGVTRAVATSFIGFDWSAPVGAARSEADRAITALGGRSPVKAADLKSLETAIDNGAITPSDAVARFGTYLAVTGDAVTSGLDRLESDAHQSSVVAALESLRVASALVDAATLQGIDLGAVWFPGTSDTTESNAAVLARFGAESANYAAAVARLRQLGVGAVVAELGGIEADPGVQAFGRAVADTLAGQPLIPVGGALDKAKLATALKGYLTRDGLLDGLVVTSTAAVRGEAGGLAASQRTAFLVWALGAAVFALASVGVALGLARSISKPLKDLAGYAHAVNEGDLDLEPPESHLHGPAETRVAFGVFSDLVANLQLLDAKANALAHCDFGDPVLAVPLPGRLGRSLESSVALLSGSIVERDQLQTHLAHEATHDSLTGIANRPAAIAGIAAAMARSARSGAATAVLFVDLNEFKAVNDSHGHEIGDTVLQHAAVRMGAVLRAGDFLARLGGDEFVIVAETAAVGAAVELAQRVLAALAEPMAVAGTTIHIGAAIGIALCLDGPEEPLRLLARADAAMYRAKARETSAVELFDADLQQQMIEREDIEAALGAALADPTGGGLTLLYQPVISAHDHALIGVEALIRWQRPGHHQLLTPASFIPIAEATTLIIELDNWVLAHATAQLAAWASQPELAHLWVSVNISGRHLLSHQLPDHITTALHQTGINPTRLGIEITETVLLTDLIAAAHQLQAVRHLGINVAIDDFGTGYTSLAHLQHLPIDTIKIDRSFTAQLNTPRGRSLIQMITDLGHAIGVDVTAEGVETPQEQTALQTIGADHLQGHHLSPPITPTALTTWAHNRAALAALDAL